MKQCPECGTLYEDHITHCIADGAELEAQPEPAAPTDRRWLLWLLLVPVLFCVVFVVGLVGLAVFQGGTAEVEQAPVQHEVVLDSVPSGARVFEGDVLRCTTPCTLVHQAEQPLPRRFVLRADGHAEARFEMTSTQGPFLVELPANPVAEPATGEEPPVDEVPPEPGPATAQAVPRPSPVETVVPTPAPVEVAVPEPVVEEAPEPVVEEAPVAVPAPVVEPEPAPPEPTPPPAPTGPELAGRWTGSLADRPLTLTLSGTDTLGGRLVAQIGPNQISQPISGTASGTGDRRQVQITTANGLIRLEGSMGAQDGGGKVFVRGKSRGSWTVSR